MLFAPPGLGPPLRCASLWPQIRALCNRMTENQTIIQKAHWQIGDYYSRLGGAACPGDMYDSYIPTFVICRLLNFDPSKYTSLGFVETTKGIPESFENLISLVSAEDLMPIIHDFYKYCDSKLRPSEKSSGWFSLAEELNINA